MCPRCGPMNLWALCSPHGQYVSCYSFVLRLKFFAELKLQLTDVIICQHFTWALLGGTHMGSKQVPYGKTGPILAPCGHADRRSYGCSLLV